MNLTEYSSRASGDEFRAKMADLDWIAGADAVQLRAAVHALCWRSVRSTLDKIASDPRIAAKVLIVARAVCNELDARIDAADNSTYDNRNTLLRRRAAAESIVSTCDAAVQLTTFKPLPPDEAELIAAITRHRDAIDPRDVCDADRELWKVLDRIESRPRRGEVV